MTGEVGIHSRHIAVLVLLLVLGISACANESILLSHAPLAGRAQRFDETLAMDRRAEDLREDRSRIGRSTITLFAITAGDARTTRPVEEEEVVRLIAEALQSVGYQVRRVDSPGELPNTPMMNVAVEEFSFQNYTWLWPYVPTWGDIILRVTLRDAAGDEVFEQAFSGSGRSTCLETGCGFSKATAEAMAEILEGILTASESEKFRLAFEAPSGRAPAADVAASPPEATSMESTREAHP